MISKSTLRIEAKQKIAELENRTEKSAIIIQKLLELEKVKTANSILLYSPTEWEVDINQLRYELQAQGKNIYLPYAKKLSVGLVRKDEDLKLNDVYKIMEPITNDELSMTGKQIEVAIIPGLSFDEKGYRLGYGSGWYDRFLNMHPEIYKIGVCFSECLVKQLPHEEHDIKMDLIVSSRDEISKF
jgi:5-formyltetrahydrofolate cyclo-ligase